MTDTKHRWVERTPLPAVSPAYNTLLAVGDTFRNVLQKLQGLLYKDIGISLPTVFNGTANSTADQDFLTLTIPASSLRGGSFIKVFAAGTENNNGNPTLNFYIKINGTKHAISDLRVSGGATNRGFIGDGGVNILSLGTTGTCTSVSSLQHSLGGRNINNPTTLQTINTTTDITITLGMNWVNANNNNIFTVRSALIKVIT